MRLDAVRLELEHLRIDALLGAGEDAEALLHLDSLCKEHSVSERLLRARMLALYRRGRQSDAPAGRP